MTLHLREPLPEHIHYLSKHLRESDADEVRSASGEYSLWKTLDAAVNASYECHVAVDDDGIPVAVFGVAPYGEFAAPWLLGTDSLLQHRRELMSWGRSFVQRWLEEHRQLMNFVDKRNAVSIRWLKRLGFTIGKEVLLYDPFHPFYEFKQCAIQ
ncbi:hypothetical protein [Bacterioplanoides sp.]|uniref:hypothetical protein n=1 Tax=Bacterioplanoides sp. TaxID=2066072 RepID=UPI003AFFFC29